MNDLLSALTSGAYGFGSAFIPVLNAEAYVGAYVVAAPLLLVILALAVGVGQTVGKYVMFEGARRGGSWARNRRADRERCSGPVRTRIRHWNDRMLRLLESPRGGAATVFVSASAGLPPLAAVSIIAGTSSQRRVTFVACCLIGRVVRFAVVAAPLAYAAG